MECTSRYCILHTVKSARCRAERKVQVIFLIKYADSLYILVVENAVEYGDKHEVGDGEDVSGDLVHEHDLLPAEPVPAAHLHLLLGAVKQLVDEGELYEAEEDEHDGGGHPHVNSLDTDMVNCSILTRYTRNIIRIKMEISFG